MPLILQKIAELHLANSNRRRGNSVQRTRLRTQNEYAVPFWDSASHYNSEILNDNLDNDNHDKAIYIFNLIPLRPYLILVSKLHLCPIFSQKKLAYLPESHYLCSVNTHFCVLNLEKGE